MHLVQAAQWLGRTPPPPARAAARCGRRPGPAGRRWPLDTFRSRQYWCRTSTMFRFFILLISILNWHELDPLSMRVLITCSLVECSDICNLLKDGEDDQ